MLHRFAPKSPTALCLVSFCLVLVHLFSAPSRAVEMEEKASYPRSISFTLGSGNTRRHNAPPPPAGNISGSHRRCIPRRPPTDRLMTSLTRGGTSPSAPTLALPSRHIHIWTRRTDIHRVHSTDARRVGARPGPPGSGRQKSCPQVSFASTLHLHSLPT